MIRQKEVFKIGKQPVQDLPLALIQLIEKGAFQHTKIHFLQPIIGYDSQTCFLADPLCQPGLPRRVEPHPNVLKCHVTL